MPKENMKIDVLAHDGSPLGIIPEDVYGEDSKIGIGGAELALMTMCEAWSKQGHQVTLFNDPRKNSCKGLFEQRWIHTFKPMDKRDILIVFRSPNELAIEARGKKIWWSCDQYTTGSFKEFSKYVKEIVCISPFHQEYFKDTYGIEKTHCIDLAVRTWDYEDKVATKVPYRFLFSSVPDRGLELVANMWDFIKIRYPQATLHITSDYRLWGAATALNESHRLNFIGKKDVKFLGAVKRNDLIQEQLEAEVLLYPCIYDELFCIAVAEAQVAGIYPITSGFGALRTTNMGGMIPLDPRLNSGWHGEAFKALADIYAHPGALTLKVSEIYSKAADRFNISTVLKQWDKLFERDY